LRQPAPHAADGWTLRRFPVMKDHVVFCLGPDGLVSSWSVGAQRLMGYGATEIRTLPLSRIVEKIDNRPVAHVTDLLAANNPSDPVVRHGSCVHKDGRHIPVLIEIHPVIEFSTAISGYIGVIRTAPTMSSPIDSDFQFRRFVDNVVDYAIFLLDANGLVSTWNAGAERAKGYAAGEIIGQHFSRFYTAEDRAAGEPARALEMATRTGKYEKEGWRVRKDGTRFWASVVIDSIRDEGGVLIGFVKVTRDITERMTAQADLEQTRNSLAHAKRMEAIGQLTSGVAHGFNNLLTVVINALDLITRVPDDTARNSRLIDDARQAAQRGATLTQQLLAFSRNRSLQPAQHRIDVLISELEPMLRHAAGESVELEFLTASANIYVDVAQLESALLNLIINARDAMPGGGRVHITAEYIDLDSAQAASAIPIERGSYVAISVADCGVGIRPDVLDRVFEPFYTTKDAGLGTGLGLSQIYGFANQSGGAVRIASEVGRGTTVTLYLPALIDVTATDTCRNGEAVATAAAVTDLCQVEDATTSTVLLVEDDEFVRQSTIDVLHLLGYKVLAAADGREAIRILHDERGVDVLCSDIVMPHGMSGIDLAHQARAMFPDLRILLMSGYAGGEREPLRSQEGEFAFLAKPYRLQDLANQLHALVEVAR
jgi:PAS domain S-box-containing protein